MCRTRIFVSLLFVLLTVAACASTAETLERQSASVTATAQPQESASSSDTVHPIVGKWKFVGISESVSDGTPAPRDELEAGSKDVLSKVSIQYQFTRDGIVEWLRLGSTDPSLVNSGIGTYVISDDGKTVKMDLSSDWFAMLLGIDPNKEDYKDDYAVKLIVEGNKLTLRYYVHADTYAGFDLERIIQ